MKRRRIRVFLSVMRYLWPAVIGLVFLSPYLVLIAESLQPPRTPESMFLRNTGLANLSNYSEVLQVYPLLEPFLNSLSIEAIAVPVTLLTASLAGFALSQMRSRRWRKGIILMSSALLLVPVPALWIPRFVLYLALGLLDQLPGLAFPAIAGTSPFFVLIFYWAFRRIPQGVFEAARLDGAGMGLLWWQIAMPLARPASAVVAVLCFTAYWNDFMSPLILIRDISRHPIALRLQLLQGGDTTLLPLQMAGVTISILPVIVLFLLVQRYFWPEGRRRVSASFED